MPVKVIPEVLNIKNPTIILGTIGLSLSGVNSFNDNLCDGFIEEGYRCIIISTSSKKSLNAFQSIRGNQIFLETTGVATWRGRWKRLRSFLTERKPCIYIPNHDEAYSAASPTLGDDIYIVGVIHSDEDYHYRHFGRMATAWNACVCVSKAIEIEAAERYPELAHKLVTIPNAVPVPESVPVRDKKPEIRILYSGRLDQNQKRVFDLGKIALELQKLKVDYRLTIAGDGRDAEELKAFIHDAGLSDSVNFRGILPYQEVLALCEQNDVILLTSDFEGTPMAVLEAMARGSVPVCTTARSGLADFIVDGHNGFCFEPGDVSTASQAIKRLADDRMMLNTLSKAAWKSMLDGHHNRDRQIHAYLRLFEEIMEGKTAQYSRARGKPRPPKSVDASIRSEFRALLVKLLKPHVFR